VTLNAIIKRIQSIAVAHKQVRSFYKGLASDFLADRTREYPAVLLQDSGGSVNLKNREVVLTYKLFVVDLVHVSSDAKENEQDTHSDMISVVCDILAQMNHPSYQDWRISPSNNLQLVVEEENDMYAGCVLSISISTMYTQNVCAVPTNEINCQE
jgi:hypothetical protein